jgi:hypothetical protein
VRDPEQLAAELIAGANGHYDAVKGVVARFAELSVAIKELCPRVLAASPAARLPLLKQLNQTVAEYDQVFQFLFDPGGPPPRLQ